MTGTKLTLALFVATLPFWLHTPTAPNILLNAPTVEPIEIRIDKDIDSLSSKLDSLESFIKANKYAT